MYTRGMNNNAYSIELWSHEGAFMGWLAQEEFNYDFNGIQVFEDKEYVQSEADRIAAEGFYRTKVVLAPVWTTEQP